MQFGYIAAIIGGVAALAGALHAIYKLLHKINDAIGVDEDGRTLSERMTRVEYQLWENGGESMKDQVNANTTLAQTTAAGLGQTAHHSPVRSLSVRATPPLS